MLMLRIRRRTMPGPVGTHRHPGRGSPVLSHPATVPSQMPLRASESHSERFLDMSQYETLECPLEALYGPYSTSAPCEPCETTRDDTEHERRQGLNSPSRPCRQGHGGCDLNSVNETEITQRRAVFDSEGNRLLPSAGRGEGVRPHAPVQPQDVLVRKPRRSTLGCCQRTLLRPCRPLRLDLLSINKYGSDLPSDQAPHPVVTGS